MLPPHIEFASMKRKGNVNVAAITGIGNLNFIILKEKYVVIGKRKVPNRVTILKLIESGIK
jgi:hypothetical protein